LEYLHGTPADTDVESRLHDDGPTLDTRRNFGSIADVYLPRLIN